MSNDMLGLDRLLRRAQRAASILLVVGLAVASLSAVYIAWVTPWMADAIGPFGFTVIFVLVVGVLPLVVGLTIAIRGATRLRGLRRVRNRPDEVVATDLDMHRGRPALRFGFAGGGHVVVAAGDTNREPIIDAVRSRTLGARLPAARLVRR